MPLPLDGIDFRLWYAFPMPRVIEPDNPEEVKAALSQNQAPVLPPSQPELPDRYSPQDSALPASASPVEQPVNPPFSSQPTTYHESNEAPPKGSSNKKIALIILIIFLLVGVGLVAWLITRHTGATGGATPETKKAGVPPKSAAAISTDGWHVARNDKLHFTFKYPADDDKLTWRYYPANGLSTDVSTGVEAGLSKEAGGYGDYPASVFGVEIVTASSPAYNDEVEYFTPGNIKKLNDNTDKLTVSSRKISKNSVSGTCLDRQFGGHPEWDFSDCWFIYKGNGYVISTGDSTAGGGEKKIENAGKYPLSDISQKIFETFQFL
jgi:hypothetical protein